ncbi:CIA30 family protein [Pelagicoccus sp. SDUM812002]|uniref:CIA30 family protein n=1 Tax=Pelagicoccus sp. SDUM812002 TaxID=3041266 RepID=UPI00280E5BBA|nr:CIA30 family protein [Pelagicoccus sp. SDUM812002]MDQ8184988.1 CIA30 family protein [Pelagicoccus sp. SDUM812002]
MNSLKKLIATLSLVATAATASAAPQLVDDFSNPDANSLGLPRLFADDSSAGGKTTTDYLVSEGTLEAKGDIQPPRGQPGWASTVFLLEATGQPQDLSEYEGIQLKIRIEKGNLSISANSSEITNFDYHAAPIARKAGDTFQEVKVPFASMRRAWSEQTELNTETIASLSLIAYDMQPGSFAFEVEEIGFY